MDTQKEYYVFQQKYYQLKKLGELLRTAGVTSDELIEYTIRESLDPNSYIEFCNGVFCPIIYQCSLTPSHIKFFLWLLKHGANPHKMLDVSDRARADHILFVCHERFMPILIDKCKVTMKDVPVETVRETIIRKLTFGNLRRIRLLVKFRVIKPTDVLQVQSSTIPDLGFQVVDVLIDRIGLICQTYNEKKDIDNLLSKYTEVMKFIKTTGSETRSGVTLTQYCAGYYLHPLIATFPDAKIVNAKVIYHADADPKIVAVLRQLFNDFRYVETCKLCGSAIDERAN